MSELSILKLCNEDENKENFTSNIRSTAGVSTKYEQVIVDYEWLDLMEDTIRYLDNILRNPNRFIVNEEEIVKIELARRVTVYLNILILFKRLKIMAMLNPLRF